MLCYAIDKPYLLVIKTSTKESAQKKIKSTNVDTQDFTLVAKKDACTSTAEIDLVNNKTSDDKIDLNTGNQQNDILASHPFPEMIENFGAHGDSINLPNIENMYPTNHLLTTCYPLTHSYKTVETNHL
ncbi:hypothetical protein AVEN_251096-1 [Araneus ventricosus]|uniref:Uncharacterized protein n=1 Tax=Araneus ventricosus TaxID=182803 RepID=A0A4Y2K5C2_ARAVE|nr:hypothetical protein AVEN_251096-1 [Araneus ventricosus]